MMSACLISLNEEKNVVELIKNINSVVNEIIIVDANSQDNTALLAKECGAKVFLRQFDNFASQKNFALNQASNEWILTIDFDQRVSEGFIKKMPVIINDQYYGYKVKTNFYRKDDNVLVDSEWRIIIYNNVAQYWREVHEMLVGIYNSKILKVEDKDIFVTEYKSEDEQFQHNLRYKKDLIEYYKFYKKLNNKPMMNSFRKVLARTHNEKLDIWLRNDEMKKKVRISDSDFDNI